MKKHITSTFMLLALTSLVYGRDEPNEIINSLLNIIQGAQISNLSKDHVWNAGQYPSYIHGNFAKIPGAQLLRNSGKILDSNPFVTMWVNTILLEAQKFSTSFILNTTSVQRSLKAIADFHDKNRPPGDGFFVFWPQTLNTTSGKWYCDPSNVVNEADIILDLLKAVHIVLDGMSMKNIWKYYFKPVQDEIKTEMEAFRLPPDFDDSLLNVGLGSLLFSSNLSVEVYNNWKEANKNYTYIFKALKKYAYRPFSSGEESLVDPRTYFYIRKYLYSINNTKYPAAFVSTWTHFVSDDDEVAAMPFHVNNIDLVVGANVIYGITGCILSQLENPRMWFDDDLQVVYENTTELITWLVERNLSSRPDLALTYYPSIFNFYWFLSRTHNLLHTYLLNTKLSLPFPVMGRVMSKLSSTLRGTVTNDLLERAIADSNGLIYYQDFLGKDDRNELDEPVDHAEDVLCSTSMAINALLYTWMEGSALVKETPIQVKKVVVGAAKWLVKHALNAKAKCVVFSGSVKSENDLPFYYPINFAMLMNGSSLPLDDIDLLSDAVVAVKSIFPEKEYEEELQNKHFGEYTPVDFSGFNRKGMPFPFWSSESFTHASAVLALTQYKELIATGQLIDNHGHY